LVTRRAARTRFSAPRRPAGCRAFRSNRRFSRANLRNACRLGGAAGVTIATPAPVGLPVAQPSVSIPWCRLLHLVVS
jgi:hypothetical protein